MDGPAISARRADASSAPPPPRPPCPWAPISDPLYRAYHDQEWGVPVREARALWEKFQLDAFQAGLAWITVLRKREAMRAEFDSFEPDRLARWDEARIAQALVNAAVIRSPTKIRAMISNARVYLDMRERGEDFAGYVWSFVGGRPVVNALASWRDAPARTAVSEALSADMKRRGFKFCGPVIVYAVMQATGMVNDHEIACPRRREIAEAFT